MGYCFSWNQTVPTLSTILLKTFDTTKGKIHMLFVVAVKGAALCLSGDVVFELCCILYIAEKETHSVRFMPFNKF